MRRLILLRHAKSDWAGDLSDKERPLAERGRRVAPMVGAQLAQDGLVPEAVLCSPAVRTRETWDLVQPHLGTQLLAVFEDRLYEADADTIVQVIREVPPQAATLLVIGHNPGLEDTAECLIGSASGNAHESFREKFPTAAFAVIEFDLGDWRELKIHSGRLTRFVTPASLEEKAAG